MKEAKKGYVIVLDSGDEATITSVSDRWYVCGEQAFRKVCPHIARITEPTKSKSKEKGCE